MAARIVKYILFIIPVFFIQCKSAELINYKDSRTIKGYTAEKKAIKDKIDRGKTYEITFTLKNDEDCIKIRIDSSVFNKALDKKISIKTYFSFEKLIDLSKFADLNKENHYSAIATNYDYSWNIKPEIKICSRENPIERLTKKSKYRIRFTTFEERDFEYNILIQSEFGIIADAAGSQ